PDIDAIYMTAVQLMTGRGGWPMSSFLTSTGETFYGGTYFPRAQFLDLLHQVEKAWRENRPAVEQRANQVAAAVANATRSADVAGEVNRDTVEKAVARLQKRHDPQRGGFGAAPKFPNEPYYLFLLDRALRNDDDDIRKLIQFDLNAIARGGIYDQVGGGFHRYSTDADWLVPHFEKMLYNQAQLSRVYAQAWRLTGDAGLARVARQTLDYVLRDLTSPDGGFYSATDADSAGSEGLFFVWTERQLRAALSRADAELAIDLYGVTERGNFEGANILNLPLPLAEFAKQRDMNLSALLARVADIRAVLYSNRSKRVLPVRDEKIVTAWNGMMIVALAEVAGILQEPRYQSAALRAADFLWKKSTRGDGTLWRIHLDAPCPVPALQDDYAWLADGFIHLYDLTGDRLWLERAKLLAANMTRLFWDKKAGGYFMNTEADGIATMARPKDSMDGAVPSGNAVALHVLAKLSQRTGEEADRMKANALLAAFANPINQSPTAYSYLLRGAQLLANGAAGPQQYAARGAVKVSAHTQENTVVVDLEIRPGWHIQAHEPL
ncbi:MAG: thioredoxin domain-containing protein, partial [Paracoccaceae bacterium]